MERWRACLFSRLRGLVLVDRQNGVGRWFLSCAIRLSTEGLRFRRQPQGWQSDASASRFKRALKLPGTQQAHAKLL
jgi:hypothetical protein